MFAIIDIEGIFADTGGNQDVLITFDHRKRDVGGIIPQRSVPLK